MPNKSKLHLVPDNTNMDLLSPVTHAVMKGRITVAERTSLVPFRRGQDVQCYNYSLPYQFSKVPQVAICTHLI